MSSHNAVIDQLARAIGLRLPRRTILRGAAAALLGGATVAGVAPASAARRRVCRPIGGGCTRNAQCCIGSCATDRSLPRSRRNRCTCESGTTLCANTCVDTATNFDHCGYCDYACPAELSDTCVSGGCNCGTERACDSKIADACVDGACSCGDEPACTAGTELCISGACIAGTCTIASGARRCFVDPELNVYQLSMTGVYAGDACTSTDDCLTFLEGCGSTVLCVCAAFVRTDPGSGMQSWGQCAGFPVEWLID